MPRHPHWRDHVNSRNLKHLRAVAEIGPFASGGEPPRHWRSSRIPEGVFVGRLGL